MAPSPPGPASADSSSGNTAPDGAAALRALPMADIEDALKRATLYAARKVRARAHAEPALDPANLALSALEETLTGRRQWLPATRPLLRHLAMTIDSHVSHFFASPRSTRLRAADAGVGAEAALPSTRPGPRDVLQAEQTVGELEDFVTGRQPTLRPLLLLVTRDGLALSDTVPIMQALGQDPDSSADRQRVYRQVRALRALVGEWHDNEALA